MKPTLLMIPMVLACVEPPATDKASGQQPGGAVVPGAPEPGEQADPGAVADDGAFPKTPGPGAVVPEPGPGAPDTPPEMAMTQDEITDGVHISGTLSCEDCSGPFLVRIEDAGANPPQLLTAKRFSEAGPYSIQVPRSKKVVLMVIHDANGDGQPTPGEGIGLWTGGLLDTSSDTSDVALVVGVMPETPPIEPDEPEKGGGLED